MTEVEIKDNFNRIIKKGIEDERERTEKAEAISRRAEEIYRNPKLLITEHCDPATKEDYKAWLFGYMKQGGLPSHYYNYPWDQYSNWYIAVEDINLIPLWGVRSICVIVPVGIRVSGDRGHSKIFEMDGFKAHSIIPVFSDIEFINSTGVKDNG